jgi:hypothetical protein
LSRRKRRVTGGKHFSLFRRGFVVWSRRFSFMGIF